MGNTLPDGGVYDSFGNYTVNIAGTTADSQDQFNSKYLVGIDFSPIKNANPADVYASQMVTTAYFNAQVCTQFVDLNLAFDTLRDVC